MFEFIKSGFRSGTVLSLAGLFLFGLASFPLGAQAQILGDLRAQTTGVLQPWWPPLPPLTQGDFICQYGAGYDVVWDGLPARLALSPPYWPDYAYKGQFEYAGFYYAVRYQILANPQDFIEGQQGPGYLGTNSDRKHRIVFWVDFKNTPAAPWDDHRFDGYMMTNNKNAIAGVVWTSNGVRSAPLNIPFGFYAHNKQCTVG
jgi:hypothetical protein